MLNLFGQNYLVSSKYEMSVSMLHAFLACELLQIATLARFRSETVIEAGFSLQLQFDLGPFSLF